MGPFLVIIKIYVEAIVSVSQRLKIFVKPIFQSRFKLRAKSLRFMKTANDMYVSAVPMFHICLDCYEQVFINVEIFLLKDLIKKSGDIIFKDNSYQTLQMFTQQGKSAQISKFILAFIPLLSLFNHSKCKFHTMLYKCTKNHSLIGSCHHFD